MRSTVATEVERFETCFVHMLMEYKRL